MKAGRKWLICTGIVLLVVAIVCFCPESKDLDPSKWVTIIMRDTVNKPIREVWDGAGKVKLEDAAGNRKYQGMPTILKTKTVKGDFSKAGDSRIVYFSSGDTLIETIINKKAPYIFAYEITKASLPMKFAVYRVRGEFDYSAIDSNRTEIKWTYAFHNKNLISKFFINRYINTTHRLWMKGMLGATKFQEEKG